MGLEGVFKTLVDLVVDRTVVCKGFLLKLNPEDLANSELDLSDLTLFASNHCALL
jgi:hypothetical protein